MNNLYLAIRSATQVAAVVLATMSSANAAFEATSPSLSAQSIAAYSAVYSTPPYGGGEVFHGDVFSDPTKTVGSSSGVLSAPGDLVPYGATSASRAGFGSLGATATSLGEDSFDPLVPTARRNVWAGATASFVDFLTFTRIGTLLSGPQIARFDFTLSGSAELGAINASGASRAMGTLGVEIRNSFGLGTNVVSDSVLVSTTQTIEPLRHLSLNYLLPDDGRERDVRLSAGLWAESIRNATAAFGSTATLDRIVLPQGVGVFSASGALTFDASTGNAVYALSPSPVPLPGGIWLILPALGYLASRRRIVKSNAIAKLL
jgi:hypothetical protein